MATSSKMIVRHRAAIDGKKNSETFYTSLPANIDSDTAIAVADWARQYVNLTTDTYDDVEIQETSSVNAIIGE